ncbi:indole-3-glycerol phosphate synthase TrpC [Methanothermobacter wolfeii]|uniref:indole-3-glycerol phosphate synthase TrpC n=1 Tax=Methanothermobacter wolfeii TaxID=145261 RepID=UPI0024B36BF0|nr:indole-3-glycerol-phosphate synthase [Methanothermobacter wolfeii]MDI6702869.1 indole-3-glycerol-phosphate synthase [Methanothermobacter wolfeii]MDI6841398.1 indole-3-glycerol-phosphate synthase [Methanothermobacter wolfeii]
MSRVTIEDIVSMRKTEINETIMKKPLRELKREIKDLKEPPSFLRALEGNRAALIYEYKRASPSAGEISLKSLSEMMELFMEFADAVSVLTERSHFNGGIEYLREASEYEIPVMMKDFLVHEYQIYQARAAGAASVLLIPEVYPDLEAGIETCRELSMEPLVECRSAIDIYRAIEAGAEVIGVNNRNLEDFTVDLERTRALAPLVPDEVILVSESGVMGPEDAEILLNYGADALLIGTAVMSSPEPRELLEEIAEVAALCKPGRKRYGGDEFFEQFA